MSAPVSGSSGTLRWQALPDWERLLFGPGGLRLDAWQKQGCVEVVKDGPHRTVYFVRLADRAVYVKHRRAVRFTDVVGHLVRPSAARREWDKAIELARRGIPTVKPVAWQERAVGPLVWDSFLVTEAIDGAYTLEDFVGRLPELSKPSRQALRSRLIRSLARLTATVHEAGVVHNDLHAGNVLVRLEPRTSEGRPDDPVPLVLIDVPGVRFSGPLGWAASRESLIMFNSGWWQRTSRSERLRFWRTYQLTRTELDLPDPRAALRRIERGTLAYSRRIARRRDRRALRTNRDYKAARCAGREAHAVREMADSQLARLVEEPETLLWRNVGRPVKLGHGSVAVRADLELGGRTTPVLYKRYRPRNRWKVFLTRFRRGRAVRSWCGGHALWTRQVPTARPLAVCQLSSHAGGGCGYLATEWIEGAENLHLFAWRVAALGPQDRFRRAARCAESLGGAIGRMHACGLLHGDLKASNLLVVERKDRLATYVIDGDDVRVLKRSDRCRQAADLARLATSIQAHRWISRTLVLRFVRAYRRQFPPERVDWKRLWRRAAARSRRLIRRKRRRGEPVL